MRSVNYEAEEVVMAIREEVMRYFKGNSIGRVVTSPLVGRYSEDFPDMNRRPRNYERRNFQLENKQFVLFNQCKVLALKSNPDAVTLYGTTLDRSSEMKAVKQALYTFFEKFLPEVELKERAWGTSDGSKDKELMSVKSTPEIQPRQGINVEEMVNFYAREGFINLPNAQIDAYRSGYNPTSTWGSTSISELLSTDE